MAFLWFNLTGIRLPEGFPLSWPPQTMRVVPQEQQAKAEPLSEDKGCWGSCLYVDKGLGAIKYESMENLRPAGSSPL